MEALSRTKRWADRLAPLIVVLGATVFFSSLLDVTCPSPSRVIGLPVQFLGAFGLAMLSVGLGALAVTGCRLALNRNITDGDALKALVDQHLPTVGQVLVGAALSLLYVFIQS